MAFEPIKLTYLLILDENEGDEWRVNSAVGPPDPSPTAVTAAQNASSKKNERPTTWTAICPIEIGRNLGKLYTKTEEIFRSIRITRFMPNITTNHAITYTKMGPENAHTSTSPILSANRDKSLKSSVNIEKSGFRKLPFAPLNFAAITLKCIFESSFNVLLGEFVGKNVRFLHVFE